MKQSLLYLFILTSLYSFSQTIISGTVIDENGETIEGANVILEGTYDGTSSTTDGTFNFTTSEQGVKTLSISFISFETQNKTNNVNKMQNLIIKLRDDVNTLDAVEINSISFEAGDNAKKIAYLKPLDIVTTASAVGDVFGAFQTLPGTSANPEDGRLFVRGGDANETQIYIDGIHVAKPFLSRGNNIPTRGRFPPMLFKGVSFSTGGYSAEYGQALSGVLTMYTIDQPIQEKTELKFMTVGLSVGNTQIWDKNSLTINASYTNLAAYQYAFPDKNKWNKPSETIGSEILYRYKPNEDGIIKLYGTFSSARLDLVQEHINFSEGYNFGVKNSNLYVNGSYKQRLENEWTLFSGFSSTNDKSKINLQYDTVDTFENNTHLKIKLEKRFSNRFKLNFGTEYYLNNFDEKFKKNLVGKFKTNFDNNIWGSYAEGSLFLSKKLAGKLGVRIEKSDYIKEFTFSPRTSIAYKTTKNSQISLAYGQFNQQPKNEVLKYTQDVSSENTGHYIANYQFTKNKQIFRIDAYYKKYNDLIKYTDQFINPNTPFSNLGTGTTKGIDLFWRDEKNIKNLSYWVSYSLLDTKRDYKNYPIAATPNFTSKHNASIVGKYWINSWKSQVGLTHNFASGRTYNNPNIGGFLNQKTKNYNATSFNIAHLITPQKILYFSVNNIFGTQNISNYRYKNQPNINGIYDRQAIVPNAKRFFFVGFFWTISEDGKNNQLNTL